ncbi:MAG: acyl--CoA ligase [Flavobacteriales bacterium]|nr:acyl--CoA ligase [Flavobacteriales bacterium]MBK7086189.1 acyl--CoA ligase [Flavobacteriales bacterium]MBK7271249.1 acyl--CoA ligase [Flavobacteriales bacterium]MBK7754216.1 acyl--CoA ligase [Flavobacteriales bacterium]MBK9074531.1 acyl--CoA ligase [Flavobacteriales bacterium]
MNVFERIKQRAARWPGRPAIHCARGTLTFQQVIDAAEQVADDLVSSGVKAGTGLGISDHNSAEFIIAMLAGLRCGAVVVPIASNLTTTERDALIEGVGLHALLCEGEGERSIFIGTRHFHLRRMHRAEERIAPHIAEAAFIRFTSGTTGTSKGVVLSHRTVIERVEAANKGLGLSEHDAVVWVLPMAYHFVVSIMLYLYFGTAVILCADFTAQAIAHCAARFKGTLLYAAPTHIRLLVADRAVTSLGTLRSVISTSAGLPLGLCAQFKERFGLAVSQAFGIIEVGLPIINTERSDEAPEAVGHALPDHEVAILDDALHPLPDGSTGLLAVRGPGLFDGYLSPPVSRDQVLRQGWFLTGDLAVRTADGLVSIKGRRKSMINIAGNKVFPEDVEAVVNAHPQVQASRVFGGAHPLFGEIVEAEVVLAPGAQLDPEDIVSFCRERLSAYKLPQRIHFVEALAMTATGKVKRV